MNGYYEIKQAKDGQFYFNLKAGNHEIILSSELYGTMAACDNGIASVQKNCQNDEMYERREAKNGKDYFVLKARNHQEIGRSEMYESKAAMENGIASVVRNGVAEVIKYRRESCVSEKTVEAGQFEAPEKIYVRNSDPLATSPDYDTGDCKYQSTLQRLVKLNEWRNCMTISEVATVLDALRKCADNHVTDDSKKVLEAQKSMTWFENTIYELGKRKSPLPEDKFNELREIVWKEREKIDAILKARG